MILGVHCPPVAHAKHLVHDDPLELSRKRRRRIVGRDECAVHDHSPRLPLEVVLAEAQEILVGPDGVAAASASAGSKTDLVDCVTEWREAHADGEWSQVAAMVFGQVLKAFDAATEVAAANAAAAEAEAAEVAATTEDERGGR